MVRSILAIVLLLSTVGWSENGAATSLMEAFRSIQKGADTVVARVCPPPPNFVEYLQGVSTIGQDLLFGTAVRTVGARPTAAGLGCLAGIYARRDYPISAVLLAGAAAHAWSYKPVDPRKVADAEKTCQRFCDGKMAAWQATQDE